MNILFITCVNSELPVQLPLARALRDRRRAGVVFCFNGAANNLHREAEACRTEGFKVVETFRTAAPPDVANWTTSKAENRPVPARMPALRARLKMLVEVMHWLRLAIARERIDVVIVSNNKKEFLMPYLLRAVHLQGKPVVMVPFGLESMRSYHEKLSRHNEPPVGWVLGGLFKNWTYRAADGSRRLCASMGEIALYKLFSASPPRPNSPYGGAADWLFAENACMAAWYAGLVPASLKIVNTGAVYNDALQLALQNRQASYERLCLKYGLDPGKEVIVVSIPQFMPAFWDKITAYKTYGDFLEDFLTTLATTTAGYNVFLSVHPRMQRTGPLAGAEFRGLKIVDEFIGELIPLCAFFLCCESSTIRMAVACNKPVLNYDLYDFGFDLYPEEQGVARALTAPDFARTLAAFCRKEAIFNTCLEHQRKILADFGPLDGHAIDRMLTQLAGIAPSSANGRVVQP